MIDKLFKNFRRRFSRTNDTLDEQLSDSAVPDGAEEEVAEYQVASAIHPLAIWTPPVAEQMANQSEAERLQQQIDAIDNQLRSLEEGILQMRQELDAKFPHLVGELYTLRAQLEAEFLRLTEGQRNEEFARDDADERDSNGLTPEEQEELARIEAEVNANSDQARMAQKAFEEALILQGTKLFRQIAMRTHPDRTKDTALHEIFKQAQDAYERKDWERLTELWMIIGPKKSGVSNLFANLLSRVSALREQLHKKEKELFTLKSDKDFGMYRDYQVPAYRARVEAHYKTLLEFNIRQTKQVLASMGAQDYESFLRTEVQKDAPEPSRERPYQAQQSTRSPAVDKYFKSHSVMGEKVDNELESPWAEDED